MKLSYEENDNLHDLTRSDGYRVLLKALDSLKSEFDRRVLECDLGTGSRDLLIDTKLRAEGAAQFKRALVSMLEKTKHPPLLDKKSK